MTVATQDLASYEGKSIILTVANDDGSAREVTGKVEAASEAGMAFREKGKRDVELVMPNEIVEIALAPEKPKKINQKKLKPISDERMRQHLADRHGFTLEEVNGMTDSEAVELHDNIDHSNLGHRHEGPDEDEDENGENESADEE